MVTIDKIQKPLKSIAEIVSSLPLCIWIVCATPGLVCGGGGGQGIGTPCILMVWWDDPNGGSSEET